MTSGGKRKGAGRPFLPDDERRDYIVRVRLTADELADLQAVVSNEVKARDVLLAGVDALTPPRRKAAR